MSKKNNIVQQPVVVEDGAIYVLQPGISVFVKTADMCSAIGVSNQWVGQLTSQGILSRTRTPHGSLYELNGNMSNYCASIRGKEVSEDDAKLDKARRAAEVTLRASKAQIAKMEADELRGKMHRSEDVAAMTEDLIYTIRGSLMALPGRLAVDVAATATPAEAAEIIRKEVHALMRELANYQYDPEKYEERVRERRKWEAGGGDVDDE